MTTKDLLAVLEDDELPMEDRTKVLEAAVDSCALGYESENDAECVMEVVTRRLREGLERAAVREALNPLVRRN